MEEEEEGSEKLLEELHEEKTDEVGDTGTGKPV